jgi:hypothetical protein
MVPFMLALKAEALYLADRTVEALEAIHEALELAKYSEEHWVCAELHRLRGLLLAATAGEEEEIERSFLAAIETAKQQKSVPFLERAEKAYAEHHSESERHGREHRARRSGADRHEQPEALTAVHEFLGFQIQDRRTGDPLTVLSNP